MRVRKFVVEDSVEETIICLQRRKADMAREVLSDNNLVQECCDDEEGGINASTPSSRSKPTLEDFKVLLGR